MGFKAIILIMFGWAFSFLLWENLPNYIIENTSLYQLTFIIWNVSFALLFVIFGIKEKMR